MGLFDGRGPSSKGSSAHVATLLKLPVVFVVEASRQAGSVAALVRGFRDHQPGLQLAGVVLNGVGSERHQALLTEALAGISVPLLGALPRHGSLELPSRHLGLLPAHELADLNERQGAWADLAERHLDLAQLWPLLEAPAAATACDLHSSSAAQAASTATIAIARNTMDIPIRGVLALKSTRRTARTPSFLKGAASKQPPGGRPRPSAKSFSRP
jgi:cobyrinic acid a,c-diamide synthase